MVARCYQGISLQMAKRIGMVASRCCWVADGGAVLLGNVMKSFHGGAEWHSRFLWWPGVIRQCHCKWLKALDWWLPGVAGLWMVALCY